MDKSRLFYILTIFIITFSISTVTAQSNLTSEQKIDKAYDFLGKEVEKGFGNTEENALAILALKNSNINLAKKGAEALVNKSKNNKECWPASACTIKDTALAILALRELGEDTSKAKKFLLDNHIIALQSGEWQLQLETITGSVSRGTCTITYTAGTERTDAVTIKEDRTLELQGTSLCFDTSPRYWLGIKSACLDKEFVVDCTADEFVINLHFVSGNTRFIFPESKNKAATVKIKNKCLPASPGGTTCNYDATQYASYVLALEKEDLTTLAFLEQEAENNKPLSYAFLSLIKKEPDFASQLASLQKSAGNFDTDRFFQTALATFAMKDFGLTSNVSKAEDYLLKNQNSDFSWGTRKLRDTAAVLAFAFGKPVAFCGNAICDAGESETSCAADCAPGKRFCEDFGYTCCKKEADDAEIFPELICSQDKICATQCKTESSTKDVTEKELCNNGIDDDNDILVDCEDTDCDRVDRCEYGRELSCDDNFDNDRDNLLDCDDSDCSEDKVCKSGITIIKKKFPWLYVVIGIAILAVIITALILLQKKKGKRKETGLSSFGIPPLFPPPSPPRPAPIRMPQQRVRFQPRFSPRPTSQGQKQSKGKSKIEDELKKTLQEIEKI